MAKTKKMAFGGMGNMPTRGMGQAMSTNTRGPVMPGKPMPPGMAPTRGPVMPGKPMPPGMAPGTRGQGTPMPPSQMQQAGAGIPAFAQQAARGALGKPPPQYGTQTQMPPGQGLGRGMAPPSQMLQSSGPTPPPMPQYGQGPGQGANQPPPMPQYGGPGQGFGQPPNAAQVGMFKKGGAVKARAFAKGGSVKTTKPKMGSASSRGDGIAQRGKTKGRMV